METLCELTFYFIPLRFSSILAMIQNSVTDTDLAYFLLNKIYGEEILFITGTDFGHIFIRFVSRIRTKIRYQGTGTII